MERRFLLSLISLVVVILLHSCDAAVEVAIIGRGIAGASCATKLREIFGSGVEITAFDGGPTGGRAQAIDLGNNAFFEVGASIIHKRNRLMVKYITQTNLTRCEKDGSSVLAIFNGVKPIFVGSSNWLWNIAKLVWRYNYDLFRIQKAISALLDEFDNIYRLQDNHEAFADLESMLAAWSSRFASLLRVSLTEFLRKEGYSERFIDELANAATRNNYNQKADSLHAFVGQVALTGTLSGLFAVRGGNFRVPERLFEAAGVDMVDARVKTVEETSGTLDSPSFTLHLDDNSVHRGFDFVVLAAPRYPNASSAWPNFVNIIPDLPPLEDSPYQPVTSAIVQGRLNRTFFQLPDANSGLSYAVLMTGKARTEPINSVTREHSTNSCSPTINTTSAWRVFASTGQPLSSEWMRRLFDTSEEMKPKLWSGAYPRYSVPQAVSGRKFLVAPGIIATSPIETLASAMEMSAISGVNAALLIRAAAMEPEKMTGRAGSGRAEHARDEL